ncbi:uncharacterized protein HMPREF1541_01827 [Cyphellophora europaea CBS 101466]|uniref:MOSC domain-containing protein n=1 Tax=Cyphellophora europaea (strain CBS 101466) TaxID=1220924 RepID=W2S256_CYPE1|nr:uncharacterized protein HMPREF1541_01827 [Cyphellophora europaea CBS 101466]ETN42670.1 hypothetical protein HMPREF1541_01827 [Cyphellophora europaea CBS 101466]
MSEFTGTPPSTSVQELFILLVPSLLIPAFFFLVRRSRSEPNPYIYEKLGLKGESNLRDEEDPKYAISEATSKSGSIDWKLKAILCHPIKSCGGFELATAKISGSGILWDRKFVIAEWAEAPPKQGQERKTKWLFRTMRAPGYERLALVKPEIWLRKGSDTDGLLIVRYPYVPSGPLASLHRLLMTLGLMSKEVSFEVPLEPPAKHNYPKEELDLWKDSPIWLNYQRHVPRSLQTLVQAKGPVTLFRVDPASYREVHGNAPKKADIGYQPMTGASDSYPLSIQNLASVRDLAAKISDEIPHFTIRRLRPNFVVSGGPAFDEDDWKCIKIGKHDIYTPCRTTRCKLPCVDPDTAKRHPRQPEEASDTQD